MRIASIISLAFLVSLVPACGSDDGGGGDTGSPDAADTSVPDTPSNDPIACDDVTCSGEEYCVQPCCGGAAPFCMPAEMDGTCPPGYSMGGFCVDGEGPCAPNPCTPPPGFCAPLSDCTGDDCPASGCFGGDYDPATRTFSCRCG